MTTTTTTFVPAQLPTIAYKFEPKNIKSMTGEISEFRPTLPESDFRQEDIDELAALLIECGKTGLAQPVVVCQTEPDELVILHNHLGYYAAKKAKAAEPRICDQVNIMIVPLHLVPAVAKQYSLIHW